MIDLFFASYMLIDYLMSEKESMEQTRKWLAKERNPEDRKELKELIDWHRQNYMQFLNRPPEWVPSCVKDFVLGYRKERPSFKEIQEEYGRRREYFKGKEKIRIKIALACAAAAVLYVLFKFKSGN